MDSEREPGTALRAYLWQCEQAAASSRYVHARLRQLTDVLWRCRLGELSPDWRDRLGAGMAAAEDVLVRHELATMPTRAWEPFVASGDWRTALDEWYSDWVTLDDYRVKHERRPQDPIAGMVTPFYKALNESPDIARGQQARDRAWVFINIMWGALYRGGLAAGGMKINWREWVEEQAQALRPEDRARVLGLKCGGLNVEQLPAYWTQSGPSLPPASA
jgi:hypothetical protein